LFFFIIINTTQPGLWVKDSSRSTECYFKIIFFKDKMILFFFKGVKFSFDWV